MRERLRDSSGQSLLEFAMLFPLMFLLVVNVVNFGGLFYSYITVTNASRAGAEYMMMGPASVYGPGFPSVSAVQYAVRADMVSLPYSSSATVAVCSNNQGSAQDPQTCTPPTDPATGAMYTDPQYHTSVLGTVEVNYTYCPFIKFWNYPALGIYSTLPSCTVVAGNVTGGGTTIRRVAVVRLMQ